MIRPRIPLGPDLRTEAGYFWEKATGWCPDRRNGCACGAPEKAIIGTWKHQKTVLGVVTETTYVFKEDGTGVKSGLLDIAFTYTFSGEKLLITTATLGIENTEEYTYQFHLNELVLTGEKETLTLEKVK